MNKATKSGAAQITHADRTFDYQNDGSLRHDRSVSQTIEVLMEVLEFRHNLIAARMSAKKAALDLISAQEVLRLAGTQSLTGTEARRKASLLTEGLAERDFVLSPSAQVMVDAALSAEAKTFEGAFRR